MARVEGVREESIGDCPNTQSMTCFENYFRQNFRIGDGDWEEEPPSPHAARLRGRRIED